MAHIIYYPKPLSSDFFYEKKYFKSILISEAVLHFKISEDQNLAIFINGDQPENIDKDFTINIGDFVQIYSVALGNDGGQQANKVVGTVSAIALIGATAFGAPTPILLGIAAASTAAQIGIRALATLPGANTTQETQRAESPSYSLSASGNSFRPNAPLPLVLGDHRIFPDFSSQPYTRFVNRSEQETSNFIFRWIDDGTITLNANNADWHNSTFNIGGTVYTVKFWRPASIPVYWGASTGNGWVRRTEGDLQSHRTRGAAMARTPFMQNDTNVSPQPEEVPDLVYPTWLFVTDPTAPLSIRYYYITVESAVRLGLGAPDKINGTSPTPISVLSSIKNFTYKENQSLTFYRREQQLKQIMNFGFGDLTISERKIGQTDLSSYRNHEVYSVVKTPLNWTMPILPDETTPASEINSYKEFNSVEGNVDVAEGGELINNEDTQYANNYIIRESPDNTYAIEVNVEGRVFGQDSSNQAFVSSSSTGSNAGFVALQRELRIQYRLVGTIPWLTILGNINFAAAIDASGFYNFEALDYDYPFRETFITFDNLLPPGKYEVRIAKYTPDEDLANNVCSLKVTSINFYQTELQENFVAQNREGLKIRSSSQLNGKLDRYSAYVRVKCWKNDGSGNYNWDYSTNPADWYLYFARGGFVNPSADGTFIYPYSPTVGWVNSADHPDNERLIWGCGISEARIDHESLNNWWNFCNDNDLHFSAVIDDSQNRLEVLNRIAAVGRGSLTWASGRLGVVYEDPNQPAVAMFSPSNIIRDSFSVSYNTENLPDKIIVQFVNPENNWTLDSVEALSPGILKAKNIQTVTMWGVFIKEQAQREANLIAARSVYNRRVISWETDLEGLICQRGDVVYLSHDLTQWGWSGRILEAEVDLINVIKITVDSEMSDLISEIHVRLPDNTFLSLSCSYSNRVITIIDPWPLSQFAEFFGNQKNEESSFLGTHEIDFMLFADISANSGKKVRIVNMSFSENKVSIEAIDEELAYYGHEFDGLPDSIGLQSLPDYTRAIAKIFNITVEQLGGGKAKIKWQSEGAIGATAQVSINGATSIAFVSTAGITLLGNEVIVEYVQGDNIVFNLTPFVVGMPFEAIADSVSFTLDG